MDVNENVDFYNQTIEKQCMLFCMTNEVWKSQVLENGKRLCMVYVNMSIKFPTFSILTAGAC